MKRAVGHQSGQKMAVRSGTRSENDLGTQHLQDLTFCER